jgi:DNA modification methylase
MWTPGKERFGPGTYFEEIVKGSSKKGDIFLDPFCGSGATLITAHKLKRKWIGMDVNDMAISTTKGSLEKRFPRIQYKTIRETES